MIILDENLIHAGARSLYTSFSPIPSLRYFSYIHHKDKDVVKDLSFNHFDACGDDCRFCNDSRLKETVALLKDHFSVLESDGVALMCRNGKDD